MRYDILKFVVFPYVIHVIAQKGKLLPPPIDNVWENCKLQNVISHDLYMLPSKNWRCCF